MGKIVSVYERPSGTNSVREPRFDCIVQCRLLLYLPVYNVKVTMNKTLISAVLYRCENCCLILREERELRVFTNKMPRKPFEVKKDEGRRMKETAQWRSS
jgi:hypothetical protein